MYAKLFIYMKKNNYMHYKTRTTKVRVTINLVPNVGIGPTSNHYE